MTNFIPTTGFVDIGELFVCNCNIPLAKRTGLHEYELIKFHNGQRVTINTQFEGGMTRIKCKKCGRGFVYIQVKESIGLVDKVVVASKPNGDTLKE